MKKSWLSSLLICCLLFPTPLTAFGQDPPAQQVSIRSAEVLLDVVVKDKKGKFVKNLNAADLEVFEDGAKQQIESFRLVTRPSAANPETEKAEKTEKKENAPANSGNAVNLTKGENDIGVSAIALVFDRLSQDARKRAHDSALTYIGETTRPNDFMGVFTIDLSMRVLQNYTTDNALIRAAIDKAGASGSASFASNAEQARSQNQRITQLQQQVASSASAASAAGAAGGAAAGSAAGAADVDRQFAEMTRRTLETFEVLERDQQGYATSNGLLAVINSMKSLPGRKAVVFFSEGLAIPPNVLAHFRSVINNANKSNVSIYAIDSAGLRAISANTEARDEINAIGRRRLDSDSTRPDTGRPMTAMLERNEDLIRLNPQSGLTQLAIETGGAFIGDTNNIGLRLRQVDEDLHTYYLVSYVPTNQNIDGKFRQVSIKPKRDEWDVQTRKGYFAVNATGYVPMLFYESPALVALNKPIAPNAFPIQSLGFNFPDPTKQLRTVVEVQAETNSFTFTEDKAKKTFSTNFTILALIKDSAKQVVGKLSRQYVLSGPLDKMKASQNGAVLFYKETDLPPGRYEVETVAYDAPTDKASVRRFSLDIPETDESKLRLSSIALIQRAEQTPAGQKTESFFQFGDIMIYPNLGGAFKKSAKQVGFYFVVYPAKGSKPVSEFTLQVAQGNKLAADFPLKLGAADAQGRIQYASAIPIDSLSPGTYELKIIVKDGQNSISRSQTFILEP
ncbi:MAG: VWA domain-containing protein [Blastocatellia bacterium]